MANNLDQEIKLSRLSRDTRSAATKFAKWIGKRDNIAFSLFCISVVAFFIPKFPAGIALFLEPLVLFGLAIALISYVVQITKGLPLRFPKSSNVIDPNEKDLKTGKPLKAEGIVYLGNDLDTGEEIWLSDSMARTHMMFLGTTGSGKALPDRSLILTPQGWRQMGDIQVGDILSIPGGKTTKVKGVFPQGRKKMFKLVLANGLASECCEEHLWLIRTNKTDERVARTDELISMFKNKENFEIPVISVVVATNGLESTDSQWSQVVSINSGEYLSSTCILVDSKEHLFITGDMSKNPKLSEGIVTHNTEFLLSVVYNALIHGSGFIYVDGKADSSLYGKIYSMARQMGREDSVRVINFQTGAKDIFGPQPTKMSNTVNPFAVGSSGMLTNLVVSLMSSGKGDVWENRAISFVEALMKPLVFLRDNYGLLLDVEVIRDYFELKKLEDLAWRDEDKYPGLEDALGGMRSYMDNLPAYQRSKHHQQAETVLEQHGFITMQLVRTFNSLADTYGYIMKTPLAEIDFLDVFLNRRILVVLLPALEKSPSELQNLGKIIVASIKATMAVGLGSRLEGSWAKILDSKPTNSPSPFMCVLDEYGYYAVDGFAVVPAQARSLGFSAIFAGQDLPAFQKSSEKEADSTLANTNTKLCGKLICVKTAKFFTDYSGQGYFTKAGGFEASTDVAGGFKDTNTASIEKMDRITLDDLMRQETGRWTLWFGPKIIKMKSFFSSPAKVPLLRVTRMLRVARPQPDAVSFYRKVNRTFVETMADSDGLSSRIDGVPVHDFIVIADALTKNQETTGIDRSFNVLQAYMVEASARAAIFDRMLEQIRNGSSNQQSEDADESMETKTFDAHQNDINDSDSNNENGDSNNSGLNSIVDSEFEAETTQESSQESSEFEEMNENSWMTYGKFDDHKNPQMMDPDTSEIEPMSSASIYGLESAEGEEGTDSSQSERKSRKRANAAQGQLDRDHTVTGIQRIESAFGVSQEAAAYSASVVSDKVAYTTKYPITKPSGPITAERFAKVINAITESLGGTVSD